MARNKDDERSDGPTEEELAVYAYADDGNVNCFDLYEEERHEDVPDDET